METIKINDRLLTAAAFVREGRRLADIGTDHAYLPIYLVSYGKVSSAIAADINRGPIEKARENIIKYGFEEKISTVLCDGLALISPECADDIAIFGMGGELIVKIIDEAKWLRSKDKRLILQPMTHPEKLREYLAENGFSIIGEAISLDRGKIYQTVCAEFSGVSEKYDAFTLLFGKFLLKERNELLISLMKDTERKLLRKLDGKRMGNEDISYETEILEGIRKYIERNENDGQRIVRLSEPKNTPNALLRMGQ